MLLEKNEKEAGDEEEVGISRLEVGEGEMCRWTLAACRFFI